MTALEIARQFAEAGEARDACRAYALVANDGSAAPEDRMEAALYILQAGDNYRISYLCLLDLYGKGVERENILPLLTEAFYEPNLPDLRRRYRENCRLLKKYPYCFRKDFPAFESLPIRFYPFDEGKYVPFHGAESRFDGVAEPGEPVVRHWFFRDLEQPVRADDLFSQYELEYLCDSVRKSEYIGRDNHVYLCYADWETFCAWLSVLDMEPVLREKKAVFLFGEERGEYPLDFAARFGVDYSQYDLKPVGIREINRLIWHIQLSGHNGGDFFNEIFDAHPNLLFLPSVFLGKLKTAIDWLRNELRAGGSLDRVQEALRHWNAPWLVEDLWKIRHPSDKDLLAAYLMAEMLRDPVRSTFLDRKSRISPAVFIQPHFPNIKFRFAAVGKGFALSETQNMDEIHDTPFFEEFRYIKAFVPIRRFTTSYGGSMRFRENYIPIDPLEDIPKEELRTHMRGQTGDLALQRVLNRSFQRDPSERLYRDSVMVRLEDGKLNPRATFTALARFLDIPYTQSMTYCSEDGERDPHRDWKNYAPGFSLESVYADYHEYCGDQERVFIEYFLRDAYRFYGYGFQYWDGKPMDLEQMSAIAKAFQMQDSWNRQWTLALWRRYLTRNGEGLDPVQEEEIERETDGFLMERRTRRLRIVSNLMEDPQYVNRDGIPLQMIPWLKPDPDLLENPLYH